jgi:hypothetical protein
MTYYKNLPRHLTADEESLLDAIVAAERPQHGVATPRWPTESPRVWAEGISQETAGKLDSALARMGLGHD